MAPQNSSFLSKAVRFRTCAIQRAAHCDMGVICWNAAIVLCDFSADLLRQTQHFDLIGTLKIWIEL